MQMKDRDLIDILKWLNNLAEIVQTKGVPLSENYLSIAKEAKINHINKIKILYVDDITIPDFKGIKSIENINTLLEFGIGGMTLGYSIILNKKAAKTTLVHELRHVAQFELFDSLESFLVFYLKEIEKFGYRKGPLEKDAISFSKSNLK